MGRHLLIATHGGMAGGIKESLGVLVGNTENITAINCFTQECEPKSVMAEFFANLPPEDELIVLTDIMGGSVNQMFMEHLDKRQFHLITGINLPLVLQVALCFDETASVDFILEAIELAKCEIKYVNHALKDYLDEHACDVEEELF